MMGELIPQIGEVRRSIQARFALVNQHHADQIDFELTPLQYMLEKFPGDGSYAHEQALRGHLSTCGVTGCVFQCRRHVLLSYHLIINFAF